MTSIDSPNKAVLDEANLAAEWIRARKGKPIWARKLDQPQTIITLEGQEHISAGNYVCRGEAGDVWPQTESTLLRTYNATDDAEVDRWRKYIPRPDSERVLAIQLNHPFDLLVSWGKLSGKAYDYLVIALSGPGLELPR